MPLLPPIRFLRCRLPPLAMFRLIFAAAFAIIFAILALLPPADFDAYAIAGEIA